MKRLLLTLAMCFATPSAFATTGELNEFPYTSGADRLCGWDESASGPVCFTLGTNLSTTGTTLNAAGGSSLADGDYGDITVSGTGTVLTIDSGLDAARIGGGAVSNTEYSYLDGVTSALQTQLNTKITASSTDTLTNKDLTSGTNTFPTFNQNTTGSAAKLTTARTIGGVSFDGTANITVASATGGFTVSGGDLAIGANNLTITGSIGSTGSRSTKGWFTDLQVTNAIAGSITGNAATVTTNANLTGAVTSSGNATSLGSFSSSNLLTALTDETGSGLAVFGTSPRLVTSILDTNGNILWGLTATGSAVNYLQYANSASNTNVSWTSTGSSTNIGQDHILKGSGTAKFYTTTSTDDKIEIAPKTGGAATFSGILTSVDLTAADKTWTFPNVNGTVITTGDTGTVTNTMLAGSIDLTTKVTGDLPFANLTQGSARSVLGVTGNSTADVASIQGTADQVLVVNGAGTALTFATVATAGITNNAVTGTKIAMGSDAQGDIMYYDGTDYTRLAPGTSGQFLKTQGASANPVWATASAGAVSAAISQSSHGLAVKDVIRLSGTSTYAKAKADTAANAEVVGIVSAVADANNFTVTTSGYVTGLSGLTANTLYYLDPSTSGALTATEPSTTGQISKPVFMADTTTSGYLINYRGQTVNTGTLSTLALADNQFTLQDDGDATKQVQFQASGVTTGTTRTLTVPNASTTIVGTDATQTLTNKTIGVTQLNGTANTIAVNNTSGTANYTATTYNANASQTYSSTIAWTGTTAPSGSTNHSYSWTQIGNVVFFRVNLSYTVAGSALTVVGMDKPSDMPTPSEPPGFGAASNLMVTCAAGLAVSLTSGTGNQGKGYVAVNSGDTGYQFVVQSASNNSTIAYIEGHYFTN